MEVRVFLGGSWVRLVLLGWLFAVFYFFKIGEILEGENREDREFISIGSRVE